MASMRAIKKTGVHMGKVTFVVPSTDARRIFGVSKKINAIRRCFNPILLILFYRIELINQSGKGTNLKIIYNLTYTF